MQPVIRITSANAGAALGLNPHKSPEALIRQMVRQYHGAEPEFQGNMASEYGKLHEPLAEMDYLSFSGSLLERVQGMHHTGHEHLAAGSHNINESGQIVAIRCPFNQRAAKPPVFQDAASQPRYYAHMQIDMFCTGRTETHFFQWAPHGMSNEPVKYDQAWIDANLPALYDFYLRFQEEISNPAHLVPLESEINTQLTKKLIEEYDQLSITIDNAEARKKEVLAELVKTAKEQNATFWGRRLSKVERKGSVSYAKIVKDHLPDFDTKPYEGKATEYWKLGQ